MLEWYVWVYHSSDSTEVSAQIRIVDEGKIRIRSVQNLLWWKIDPGKSCKAPMRLLSESGPIGNSCLGLQYQKGQHSPNRHTVRARILIILYLL